MPISENSPFKPFRAFFAQIVLFHPRSSQMGHRQFSPKDICAIKQHIMEKNNCTHSKIIVHPASIEMLVNATWDFAKRILWNKSYFGEDEILLSLSYIREHYEEIPPENFQKESFPWFETYCKRIIAAKENYGQEFPHPCIWFNKSNPHGFSKSVTEHRKEMEERYKEEIHIS